MAGLLGRDLHYLAAVAELGRLDVESQNVGLISDGAKVTSFYQGTHSTGCRWMNGEGVPAFMAVTNAERFKAIAGLFPEDVAVTLKPSKDAIVLHGGGRDATLSLVADRVGMPDSALDGVSAQLDADALLEEATLAASFTSDLRGSKPIFTGLNLIMLPDRLGLITFDGLSIVYRTSVKASDDATRTGEFVAPAGDFLAGLKLIDAGAVTLTTSPKRYRLYGESAWFTCSVLAGRFPDLTSIVSYSEYAGELSLKAAVLEEAVRAATSYESGELEFVFSGSQGIIQTREMDGGRYIMKLEGGETVPASSFAFNDKSMQLISKMGDDLALSLPVNPVKAARAKAGTRTCWIGGSVLRG